MKKRKKNSLSLFLKVGITLVLLYFVFTKIPFTAITETLHHSNISFLGVSIICFILSQVLSADRLLILFRSVGCSIQPRSNYKLYLVGMFYNFFIPGGIGGDAYKVYILNKTFKWSLKKLSAAVFVDRFVGLVAIGILVSILMMLLPLFDKELLWILFLSAGIVISYVIIKRLFKAFTSVYLKTLFYSIVIQILQCLCIIALLSAISDSESYLQYVLVFLISSVLSIFSFSGIGIREMIFYQASSIFLFDSTIAVTVGFLFSGLTAFISIFGIILHLGKTTFYLDKQLIR